MVGEKNFLVSYVKVFAGIVPDFTTILTPNSNNIHTKQIYFKNGHSLYILYVWPHVTKTPGDATYVWMLTGSKVLAYGLKN